LLAKITPVILTYNEAGNIARCLERLSWAQRIVVADSGSDDATVEICSRFPRVRIYRRTFDCHANQWNFAVHETEIHTEWVLALDADYVITRDFVDELSGLNDDGSYDAYSARFRYCVYGTPLRGTLYPPVTVLFRRSRAHYVQDGHTQRLQIAGRLGALKTKINHDDRKALSRWLRAQDSYTRLEAEHIARIDWSELTLPDKIRRFPLAAPFLAFAYCYFGKGVCLDGKAGLYYALQRLIAEALLALRLIEMQRNGR
jgi:glycosyltransferase involved in cell wall biosynthesis